MAQGKLKVKAKVPPKAKVASVHRGKSNVKKSKILKRSKSMTINEKLQNEVTKEIRKNIEHDARGMAEKFGESSIVDRKKTK